MRRTRSPTWAARVFWRPRNQRRARSSRSSGRTPLGVRFTALFVDRAQAPITSSIKYLDPSIHSVNTVAHSCLLTERGKASKGQVSRDKAQARHGADTAHTGHTAQHITSPRWIHLQRVKHLKLDVHVSQRAGAATDSAEHAPSWTNASNQPKTSVEAPPGGATTRVAVRATA